MRPHFFSFEMQKRNLLKRGGGRGALRKGVKQTVDYLCMYAVKKRGAFFLMGEGETVHCNNKI